MVSKTGKVILLTGGISVAVAGTAIAEGQMETAQNSQTSNVPLERTITLPHAMQLNDGMGFSNSVPNVLKDQPLEMDKIGLKLPGENHYTAINSKKAIVDYAGFLWDHSGKGEPYTIARRDPLIQQKADLIHELLTRYKLASPKDLEAMTKAVSNGVITMEEWRNIPDGVYTIVDSNGEESTSITINVVSGKVVPLGESSPYEKPSLSTGQLESILSKASNELKHSLEPVIQAAKDANNYFEKQREQYKLGHATGPEAREGDEAMNGVHSKGYMKKLQEDIYKQLAQERAKEKQTHQYEKPKRETKREKQRARLLAGVDYSFDQNTLSAIFGMRFGSLSDPANLAVYAKFGKGLSGSSVTPIGGVSPIGLYGVGTQENSDLLSYGLGTELYLGKGNLKLAIGGEAGISTWTTTQTADIYRKTPLGSILLNSNSEIAHKVALNYLASIGVSYKDIEGDIELGYSGKTNEPSFGMSAKIALPLSMESNSPRSKYRNRK